jgi:succinate dehydrogenase/fumarate reductase flavoprotein subunit
MAAYRAAESGRGTDAHHPRFERAETASETERRELLGRRKGSEDPWEIRDELGRLLEENAGIERSEAPLRRALGRLDELEARLGRARVSDDASVHNQSLRRVRALGHGLALGRVVLESALVRQERHGVPARSVLTIAGRGGQVRHLGEFTYRSAGETVHVTDAVDTAAREE